MAPVLNARRAFTPSLPRPPDCLLPPGAPMWRRRPYPLDLVHSACVKNTIVESHSARQIDLVAPTHSRLRHRSPRRYHRLESMFARKISGSSLLSSLHRGVGNLKKLEAQVYREREGVLLLYSSYPCHRVLRVVEWTSFEVFPFCAFALQTEAKRDNQLSILFYLKVW